MCIPHCPLRPLWHFQEEERCKSPWLCSIVSLCVALSVCLSVCLLVYVCMCVCVVVVVCAHMVQLFVSRFPIKTLQVRYQQNTCSFFSISGWLPTAKCVCLSMWCEKNCGCAKAATVSRVVGQQAPQ